MDALLLKGAATLFEKSRRESCGCEGDVSGVVASCNRKPWLGRLRCDRGLDWKDFGCSSLVDDWLGAAGALVGFSLMVRATPGILVQGKSSEL